MPGVATAYMTKPTTNTTSAPSRRRSSRAPRTWAWSTARCGCSSPPRMSSSRLLPPPICASQSSTRTTGIKVRYLLLLGHSRARAGDAPSHRQLATTRSPLRRLEQDNRRRRPRKRDGGVRSARRAGYLVRNGERGPVPAACSAGGGGRGKHRVGRDETGVRSA